MTKNVIDLKEHRPRGRPFNTGPDPRRHMEGPRKGTNPLILLKKRAVEKHADDIMEIIAIIINQAKQGNERSQALVCQKFVPDILADLAADNCEDTPNFEEMYNTPKVVLENIRSYIVDQLSQNNIEENENG